MLAGIIAFAVGIGEAFLLSVMLSSVTSGNYTKATALLIIKLFSYGAAAAVLVFLFPKNVVNCAIGYGLGLPLSVVVWFICRTFFIKQTKSGDDSNENDHNN